MIHQELVSEKGNNIDMDIVIHFDDIELSYILNTGLFTVINYD